MSDFELERKESLTRAEVAKRLSVFADALAKGNKVELDLGGTSLTLRVADDSSRWRSTATRSRWRSS